MAETTLRSSDQERSREQQAYSFALQALINSEMNFWLYQYFTLQSEVWPSFGENCGGSNYGSLHLSTKQHQVQSDCIGDEKKEIDNELSNSRDETQAPDNNDDEDFLSRYQYFSKSNGVRCNHKEKDFITAERSAKFVSDRNFSLLLIASLVFCFHNALPCSSFGSSELNHNSDNVDYDYPFVAIPQRPDPFMNPGYNGPRSIWFRRSRSYNIPENDDISPTGLMPAPAGSLSQDESASSGPTEAHSWTSILTNPFGGGGSTNTNLGGNDAFDKHIKAILVPRVSGTPGNIQVRQYIVDNLQDNNYQVELDEFTASTPIGNVKFANIIASSNPKACRQLVLACHYDSKMMDGFLGATDSAVPCAMLLRISETFNKSHRPSNEGDDDNNSDSLGLKFIFFDGEEAYKQWTSTDSLYGSRHLAAKWAQQAAPAYCNLGAGKTELNRIELFVLLDLIGASDTSFVMYGTRFKSHYESLQSHERAHLVRSGHSQSSVRRHMAFRSRTVPLDFVEDDHVPFKKRGVPILLLLAHPFPNVWHKLSDNYQAIDFPKTRRILHVMEEFVANYPSKKTQ